MYTDKEKLRIFNEIPNKDAASADLELLRKLNPGNERLNTFSLNPKRYADDILYALLDLTTREEIILNRRNTDSGKKDEKPEEPVPVTVTHEPAEKVNEVKDGAAPSGKKKSKSKKNTPK